MNLLKFSSAIITLLTFFSSCKQDTYKYKAEDEKGFYTKDKCKLQIQAYLNQTLAGFESADSISKFRQQLAQGTRKWLATGSEKTPLDIWKTFYQNEIFPIIETLQKKHDTTLLYNRYAKLETLFKSPTEANEKALIEANKKVEAATSLDEAFKTFVADKYRNLDKCRITDPILDYQEFIGFITNDPNKAGLKRRLKLCQSYLKQWKVDGHLTGVVLWKRIQAQEKNALSDSEMYKFSASRKIIEEGLALIDQLTDISVPLTYSDLLEKLPESVHRLRNIFVEVNNLEKNTDKKLLEKYLSLVDGIIIRD